MTNIKTMFILILLFFVLTTGIVAQSVNIDKIYIPTRREWLTLSLSQYLNPLLKSIEIEDEAMATIMPNISVYTKEDIELRQKNFDPKKMSPVQYRLFEYLYKAAQTKVVIALIVQPESPSSNAVLNKKQLLNIQKSAEAIVSRFDWARQVPVLVYQHGLFD
ncbi:hypothetical protein DID75_01540 [Candidatus Marinamargulisbacteria bacterium SCGC AG-410-N11]|nr:hypothetical protein DID75_01540 [Candidatus Marinamargulisbacteria bacterium SCGC AG-410-N11]